MKTLHIIVSNKVASYLQRDGYIVCGNADNQVEFTFDAEWDAYTTKTARFIWGGKYKDVTFSGNVCPVPIVANTDRLEVGVYVENLSTTTSAVIPCRKSILCHSDIKSEGSVVVPEDTPVLGEATLTENGEHYPAEGYDGFYKVKVNVVAEPEEVKLQEKTATENGEVTADEGYDGLSKVTVNVQSGDPVLQEKTVTENGEVTADEGYDGLSKVTVNVETGITPSGTLAITENGTHDVTEYASVEVAVPSEEPTLEEITITENGEYTPSGDGFSKVTVNVAKEKYDGSVVISAALLSGTWLIDSEALYNLLLNDRDNVAQNINFSAGVKGSDAGVIYYTSMTFNFGTKALQYSGDDGTNSFSNYNYSAYGDGWKEYPDGDNGATVNFDEEQAVGADFYLLFTSIATKEV